jgi:hypothetical protein
MRQIPIERLKDLLPGLWSARVFAKKRGIEIAHDPWVMVCGSPKHDAI